MLGAAGLVLVVAGVILVVVLLLLLLLCLWCRPGGGLVLGAGAGVRGAGGSRGAAGGTVLVQGEVSSRNDADVELGLGRVFVT